MNTTSLYKTINKVRHNIYFSFAARKLTYPVRKLCNFVSTEITKKIRINGGRVKYDGIDLRFPKNIAMSLCSSIYWSDMYGCEPYNWQILRILLKKNNVKHFIDIGSNVGIYSILAKKYNSNLIVDAFEPVPSIFKKNIILHKANGLLGENNGSHTVLQKAISNNTGTTTLHLPINLTSLEEETTGTIRPDSWQADRADNTTKIQVETITLDDYLETKTIMGRLVIKIDVEDFEAAVFEGARKTLTHCKPYIICEILKRDHGNQETVNILTSLKYKIFSITASGLFIFSGDDFFAPSPCSDFFCIHEDCLMENNLTMRNYLSLEDIEKLSG